MPNTSRPFFPLSSEIQSNVGLLKEHTRRHSEYSISDLRINSAARGLQFFFYYC